VTLAPRCPRCFVCPVDQDGHCAHCATITPKPAQPPEDFIQKLIPAEWPGYEPEPLAPRAWPADGREAMVVLCWLFPSLQGVPGANPWEPAELLNWLANSGAPTAAGRHAARFVLQVWNSSANWVQVARAEGVKNATRLRHPFNLAEAWASWDEPHRAALLAWLDNPFHP
jgi:hypothetical protein